MDAEVHGLKQLLQTMESLPLTVQRNAIVQALRKGSEPIRAEAERLAPRLSGNLAESMTVMVSDATSQGAFAKIGPGRAGFFGHIPEFGLANNPAQPFLRPAFDGKRSEALRLIGQVLAERIEKEFRKRA